MRPLSVSLDPLAHRATMDALDAQRAAYRRYARSLDAQRGTLTDGDADQAGAVVDEALAGFSALDVGARRLQPALERARAGASGDQLHELQQRVDDLMLAARTAETAIHNLSTQLEAWRDAYGRQLVELGITPGGHPDESAPASGGTDGGDGGPRAGTAYGPPGSGREAAVPPRILDRQG